MKILYTSDLHYGFNDKTRDILIEFFKKVKDESPDIIILAGDIISHEQRQFPKILKLIRESNPDIPILAVRGNHDFWYSKKDLYSTGVNSYASMDDFFLNTC